MDSNAFQGLLEETPADARIFMLFMHFVSALLSHKHQQPLMPIATQAYVSQWKHAELFMVKVFQRENTS